MSMLAERVATVSVTVGDAEITFETGKLAKQADGAVLVRSGDTMILATAVGRMEPREGADFFPLTVDVEERMYAAGKIPGGFFKREGRPSERAILTARMIDRPIRPLWPKGFKNEVQVIATVLSADLVTPHDILCINGASAALMLSSLPFLGPVGAVRIGIDGELVVNPTCATSRTTTLDLIVVGTKDGLTMVEAGARGDPGGRDARGVRARPPRDRQALRGAGGAAPPGGEDEVPRPRGDRRSSSSTATGSVSGSGGRAPRGRRGRRGARRASLHRRSRWTRPRTTSSAGAGGSSLAHGPREGAPRRRRRHVASSSRTTCAR